MNYRIKYTFPIDQRVIELMDNSDRYWSSRGFNCEQKSTSIIGKRGSSIGNLTSFDMTKLICELVVDFSEDDYVTAELLINGKFQDITEVNLWDFKLELILFEYSIKEMDYPDFLSEYKKKRKNAAIKWSFTMMMRGRDFSTDLKDKLEGLTESNQLLSVEIFK